MPQIEFSAPESATVELMFLMMYPDDEISRRRAVAVSQVEVMARETDTSDLSLPVAIVRDILAAPSVVDMQKEQRARSSDGMIAGQIMVAMYMMHRFAQSPSINRALYAVSRYAKTTTYGDGSRVSGSEPRLRQCWSRFGPVAPLWGAFCLNYEYQFASLGEADDRKGVTSFLGVAAGLRAFAVSFVPKSTRRRATILDPKSTWEMPIGTEPTLLALDHFPKALADLLLNYKAPANSAYRG